MKVIDSKARTENKTESEKLVSPRYRCPSVPPIACNRLLRPNGLSLELLVEELIVNIDIPLDFLGFIVFMIFGSFEIIKLI